MSLFLNFILKVVYSMFRNVQKVMETTNLSVVNKKVQKRKWVILESYIRNGKIHFVLAKISGQ